MIIEKWSDNDALTKEQRSSSNCIFLRRWIIADKYQEWESIINDCVKENYLIQRDANGLLTVWRNELQLETEKGKPDDRPSFKKIIDDFFTKLVIAGIFYVVVYGFLEPTNLPSEALRDLFCFVGAIWGVTAYKYKEEGSDVWKAGFAVFLIFFVGYWILTLLRLLF